jgi:DNA-binding NarL/FixJ family response regulator
MKKISVLLVDDHALVREGLRALLNQEADIAVVGEAENGRQALQLAGETMPDIVLMDVAMPVLNGLEGTRQIRKSHPGIKILILSSYSEDDYVERLAEAGISGYVAKQSASETLLRAIREVQKGNAFFSAAIAQRMRHRHLGPAPPGEAGGRGNLGLTSREAEVLQLIAEGLPNKQIAGELGISIKTVEKHRQQVMNKLNIHDIASLTRYAISRGVVESAAPLGPEERLGLSQVGEHPIAKGEAGGDVPTNV